jgi:hypothetical protein
MIVLSHMVANRPQTDASKNPSISAEPPCYNSLYLAVAVGHALSQQYAPKGCAAKIPDDIWNNPNQ